MLNPNMARLGVSSKNINRYESRGRGNSRGCPAKSKFAIALTSTSPSGTTYLFDAFALDVPRRTLFAGHDAIVLSEKVFRILLLLLEAGGELVPKRTFFEELWPDESISEANLTQQLFVLRGLLRQHSPTDSIILTVPGSGYRLGVQIDKKAGLMMKKNCERCGTALSDDEVALICSYECTFCVACADAMQRKCPNCGGELVTRPRRGRS